MWCGTHTHTCRHCMQACAYPELDVPGLRRWTGHSHFKAKLSRSRCCYIPVVDLGSGVVRAAEVLRPHPYLEPALEAGDPVLSAPAKHNHSNEDAAAPFPALRRDHPHDIMRYFKCVLLSYICGGRDATLCRQRLRETAWRGCCKSQTVGHFQDRV